jgi:aryl-alcohol dehydrogenase-like predicted oxidoreductase
MAASTPDITYRRLGASALKVSPLCLGTMMFGGPTDEATSARILDQAKDTGINFLDTADVYNAGVSEEITGRAIAADRDWWVVATKFGHGDWGGPNRTGQSRKWVIAAAEAPLEEPLRAIGELIAMGKLRYYGLSNFAGWRIAEVCRIADALGMDRPVVSQPLYNLVDRTAEREQLPAAAHYGLGVVPYSPLARGVLSGKYATGQAPPEGSRAGRGDVRLAQTEWREESLAVAQEVGERARSLGLSTIDYAIAWVLRNRLVSAVIAGPRTEEQWAGYLTAMRARLGPEEEAFVDALVRPGHASTPGYTDPAYPVEGRVALA